MTSEGKRPFISIILPARNEEENIPYCYEAITRVANQGGFDHEVLVVDNGSTDKTRERVLELCQRDPRWRYLRLSRNFSVENSISAALHHCAGEAAVILLSDLQEPPELIPELIRQWRAGYHIVYGVHTRRPGDSTFHRVAVDLYYRLIRLLSDSPMPEHVADFRLLDRRVIEAVKRMPERNRYVRGLSLWTGFRQIGLKYERRPRLRGKSKSNLAFLVGLALQAIVSMSVKPLRLFFFLGLILLGLTGLMSLYYLSRYFIVGDEARGAPTIVLLLLANLGLTMFGLGVVGEYVGRIYTEAKRRPLWIIEETANIDIPPEERYGG